MLLLHDPIRRRESLPRYQQQRGVVIVVVLFIMVLVAALSYTMLTRFMRDTERTTLWLRDRQAEFYTQGVIAWAMDQLRYDWEAQQADRVIDPVPIKLPLYEVNGYRISGVIEDMQARFNLNHLFMPEAQEDMKRLLRFVDRSMREETIQAIVSATANWIEPYTKQTVDDPYYLQLPVPYRVAHRMMLTLSEWRLVQGIRASLFAALAPYVTALPWGTPINVQTAPVAVLMTLSETMTEKAAFAIEQARARLPFISLRAFAHLEVVKNHPIPLEKVTVNSRYFLLKTHVRIEKQHLVFYTLLERVTRGDKAMVKVIWHSKSL
jgi:general secretion pathway protein K